MTDQLRLPDFIIVGAMRSGTSSLFRYLADHPDVFMAASKELHFFDWHYERGLAWYASHFDAASSRHLLGEATPNYLYDAAALERIAAALPEVKTIALLRSPANRAYSHYQMHRARGREARTWGNVVEEELASEVKGGYLDRSRYAGQVSTLLALFGRSRTLVVPFERMRDEPVAVLGEVCDYLDITRASPPSLGRRVNAHFTIRSQRLREYSKRPGVPRALRKLVARVNQTEGWYESMAPWLRLRLDAHFREDRQETCRLVGWAVDPWDVVE